MPVRDADLRRSVLIRAAAGRRRCGTAPDGDTSWTAAVALSGSCVARRRCGRSWDTHPPVIEHHHGGQSWDTHPGSAMGHPSHGKGHSHGTPTPAQPWDTHRTNTAMGHPSRLSHGTPIARKAIMGHPSPSHGTPPRGTAMGHPPRLSHGTPIARKVNKTTLPCRLRKTCRCWVEPDTR